MYTAERGRRREGAESGGESKLTAAVSETKLEMNTGKWSEKKKKNRRLSKENAGETIEDISLEIR